MLLLYIKRLAPRHSHKKIRLCHTDATPIIISDLNLQPGYLRPLLPNSAPEQSESLDSILEGKLLLLPESLCDALCRLTKFAFAHHLFADHL
jgi:hypothetical protein